MKSSPYFWLALHRTKVRWRFLQNFVAFSEYISFNGNFGISNKIQVALFSGVDISTLKLNFYSWLADFAKVTFYVPSCIFCKKHKIQCKFYVSYKDCSDWNDFNYLPDWFASCTAWWSENYYGKKVQTKFFLNPFPGCPWVVWLGKRT